MLSILRGTALLRPRSRQRQHERTWHRNSAAIRARPFLQKNIRKHASLILKASIFYHKVWMNMLHVRQVSCVSVKLPAHVSFLTRMSIEKLCGPWRNISFMSPGRCFVNRVASVKKHIQWSITSAKWTLVLFFSYLGDSCGAWINSFVW